VSLAESSTRLRKRAIKPQLSSESHGHEQSGCRDPLSCAPLAGCVSRLTCSISVRISAAYCIVRELVFLASALVMHRPSGRDGDFTIMRWGWRLLESSSCHFRCLGGEGMAGQPPLS